MRALGFKAHTSVADLGFRVSRFCAEASGFAVLGLRSFKFKVWGSGFQLVEFGI